MSDSKRPRGAPKKPLEAKGIKVTTTLSPELHAAWKADGRTLSAIVRAALLGDAGTGGVSD